MNFTESQYCKFPRLVCISLGLWPYTYKRHRFRSFCVYVILLSGVILQLVSLTRCDRTAETFTTLGILIISIAYVSQFHGYYLNLENIRHVFDYIEDDWKMLTNEVLTNEGELETITKYANRGKILNLYMIGIFYTMVALFIAYPFVAMAWTSQPQSLEIPIYVDLLEHDRLIEYLNKSFSKHYICLVSIGVAALSLNLYVIAVFLSLKKITQKLFVSIIVVCCSVLHIYSENYLGQKIIDKGNELFMSIYSTRWYESPLPMQKTLLFVRLRCMKHSSCISTIFFVASMECLFMLTNAAVSYFMVLYTLMQRL